MNQKQIGIILIIIGLALAGFVQTLNIREEKLIDAYTVEHGSCYLSDGTCLHKDRSFVPFILGWVLAGMLVIFGVFLGFVDKTPEVLARHQREVSSALKEAKSKDEFAAFLEGFPDDAQSVLKAVKEQDGITQSTLRYKTGISKASLSLLLKDLEDRSIISRKDAGKTKSVFLKKSF